MDGKIFVLIIMAMVFGFAYFERMQKQKLAQKKSEAKEAGNGVRAELDELRERVEVLERLATDKAARLRDEIDAL